MSHYAIEVIGNRKPVYVIKKVTNNCINIVDGKRYRTLEKARDAATKLDLEIAKVGGTYEIL